MTLAALCERLRAAGVPDPETDAALLICHFCHITPALLQASRHKDFESEALETAARARASRTPLQYIIGEVGFYGETYRVTPAVLCPRPDTELLVEEAITRIPKGARFGDLCTGSGCIAVSTLAHRPDLTGLAVEISADALTVATENAERNGVADRLGFLRFDLLAGRHPMLARLPVLLSNPPYIATAALASLDEEVKREPSLALDGGADGLLFYKTLLSYYSPALFLFEIGFDQGEAVSTLGQEKGYRATVKKDLGGNDRLVILEKD